MGDLGAENVYDNQNRRSPLPDLRWKQSVSPPQIGHVRIPLQLHLAKIM
jgi:hypothetical protein